MQQVSGPVMLAIQVDPLALIIEVTASGQRIVIPLTSREAEGMALGLIAAADAAEKTIAASDAEFLREAGVTV